MRTQVGEMCHAEFLLFIQRLQYQGASKQTRLTRVASGTAVLLLRPSTGISLIFTNYGKISF